ncbi:MAG: ferredoxin [Alphaproteobacteria bacterium]|nr:ferredoxin [Alphaproteobacteria bacterium]
MTATKKLNGWHVLLILVGFFGVVIAVNAYFIVTALDTFPGEEVMHPYIKGLNYNQEIEERAEQAALGWTAEISGIKREGDAVLIDVVYRDRNGAIIPDLDVKGALKRTTHEGEDQSLEFERVGGAYVARAQKAGAGLWDFTAVAVSPKGERFELEKRLML